MKPIVLGSFCSAETEYRHFRDYVATLPNDKILEIGSYLVYNQNFLRGRGGGCGGGWDGLGNENKI